MQRHFIIGIIETGQKLIIFNYYIKSGELILSKIKPSILNYLTDR